MIQKKKKRVFLLEVMKVMTLNEGKKCQKTMRTYNTFHETDSHECCFQYQVPKKKKNCGQTTSISRRKIGITKRSSAIPARRPFKFNVMRKLSLKNSIEKNVPNSKK